MYFANVGICLMQSSKSALVNTFKFSPLSRIMVRGDKEPPLCFGCCMSVSFTSPLLHYTECVRQKRASQSCCVLGIEKEIGNSEAGLIKQGVEATDTLLNLLVMDAL